MTYTQSWRTGHEGLLLRGVLEASLMQALLEWALCRSAVHKGSPAACQPPSPLLDPAFRITNTLLYLDSPPTPENLKGDAVTGLFQQSEVVKERHSYSSPA